MRRMCGKGMHAGKVREMRVLPVLLVLLVLLFLSGCTRAPTRTRDGENWQDSWIRVGATLGVEPPGNGLTLLDNKDALSSSGIYYATWTIGDRQDYVNEEDETVDLYDAQLYLLLQDFKSEQAAADAVEEWNSTEQETYRFTGTEEVTCAGQSFTLVSYEVQNEGNPYSRGVSVFGVYETHAINAELSCLAEFDGDERQILLEFLEGMHYAA